MSLLDHARSIFDRACTVREQQTAILGQQSRFRSVLRQCSDDIVIQIYRETDHRSALQEMMRRGLFRS